MSDLQRNRPKHPPYIRLPQCCVPVDVSFAIPSYIERRKWKLQKMGWDADKCSRSGTVRVYGNDFCNQHARVVCVALVLGEVSATDVEKRGADIARNLSPNYLKTSI